MGILIFCSLLFFLGKVIYFKFKINSINKENASNSLKFENLISEKAEKSLKMNDLIFVCELRKSLMRDGVSVQDIYESSIKNSKKFKEFVEDIKKEITKDESLKKFMANRHSNENEIIIHYLCTFRDSDTQIPKSVYTKFLTKKYQLDTDFDSISFVDMRHISEADYKEFLKSKETEREFRNKF